MLELLAFITTPAPIPPGADNLSWLGPAVTAIGGVLVAMVGGASIVWRRRQDRKEVAIDRQADAEQAAQPKITDGWEEVRKARTEASQYYNLYRAFENLFYTAFGALRHLARTVRDAHPDQPLDKDVVDALAIVPPDTTDVK